MIRELKRILVSLVMIWVILLVYVPWQTRPAHGQSVSFSSPQILQYIPGDDSYPAVLQASNGTLWVAWQHSPDQPYYQTYNGASWSAIRTLPTGTAFTVDPTFNVTPTVTSPKDGRIWVTWSKLISGQYDVYTRIFNGIAWSSDTQLTSVPTWDIQPDLVQDRNGTIWLFWSRQLQLTSGTNAIFQQKLFYKFSIDNGQTWSADTQLTFYGDATNPIDDFAPAVIP